MIETQAEDGRSKEVQGLHVFTVEQLIDGYKDQKEQYAWDFSKEREFIENLFSQRVNFLLLAFSLFLTAASATSSQRNLVGVLWIGTFLTGMVSLTVWRAFLKLDITLKILHLLPKHPFHYIQREIETLGRKTLGPVNPILGAWIPVFCTVSLLVAAVLASFGIITVE